MCSRITVSSIFLHLHLPPVTDVLLGALLERRFVIDPSLTANVRVHPLEECIGGLVYK